MKETSTNGDEPLPTTNKPPSTTKKVMSASGDKAAQMEKQQRTTLLLLFDRHLWSRAVHVAIVRFVVESVIWLTKQDVGIRHRLPSDLWAVSLILYLLGMTPDFLCQLLIEELDVLLESLNFFLLPASLQTVLEWLPSIVVVLELNRFVDLDSSMALLACIVFCPELEPSYLNLVRVVVRE
ncbi:uncharacterized protein G2W53_040938 [Senna tora]|uniref:Uncharacterized protein n=1 Tax=Senna tora TaxID=362788 RepID=A0A834SJ43_9FABA|nr:uncharacterized protein G2W53_040938 [Senna tora]